MHFFEVIRKLSIGKLCLYGFVTFAVLAAAVSCVSGGFWATSVIAKFADVHVFNQSTRVYFELLIWALLVTSFQFYLYYSYTLGLYDEIAVSSASGRVRLKHLFLQLFLSIFIFMAALVLCATFFLTIMTIEIMNDLNIDISKIVDLYLPFLRLEFLLVYFVFIDVCLLAISFNFSRCPQCAPQKKVQFREARASIWYSVGFGLFLCLLSGVFWLIDPITSSSYHRTDNLETKYSSMALLGCIGLLQLLYVATDLYLEINDRSREAGSAV